MLKIILEYLRFKVAKWARQFYWLYKISKIKNEGNLEISFPFTVEGKGKISLGKDCQLGAYSVLGIGQTSRMEVGNSFCLDPHVTIKTGVNSSLSIGHNCSIEMYTRIYVNHHWNWGDNVWINTNCQFFSREAGHQGKLIIGNGCNIGDNTIIDVTGDVLLGKEVAIGPNCIIYSHDHNYESRCAAAWKGGITIGSVVIEDGAWIGSGVTIMPGITIGKRAIIAAGAVMTKDAEPNGIYVGVPGKLVKRVQGVES